MTLLRFGYFATRIAEPKYGLLNFPSEEMAKVVGHWY